MITRSSEFIIINMRCLLCLKILSNFAIITFWTKDLWGNLFLLNFT